MENDKKLTKEDYLYLLSLVQWQFKECYTSEIDALELLEQKVKSKIKNYCEHYWTIGAADCIQCSKCKKEIFFND